MKIDTVGTYTLRYSAEDDCGNIGTHDRTLTVVAPRTVLYTDGTFIINEQPQDRATNEALHGVATNEYIPFDPNGSTNIDKYIFSVSSDVPWINENQSIIHAQIGDYIAPTSIKRWFAGCLYLEDIDLSNLDSSNITNMSFAFSDCETLSNLDLSHFNCSLVGRQDSIFANCTSLPNINLSGIDTTDVTVMDSMFYRCETMTKIDTSNFVTDNVTSAKGMFQSCLNVTEIDISNASFPLLTNYAEMFRGCGELVTIYANIGFDLSSKPESIYTFRDDRKLVGGQGTTFGSGSSIRAHIDGGTSNPGYFTLKPTT